MKLQTTNNDWQTRKLVIKDKTHRTLSNGTVVPTALNMYRQINK